MRGILSEPKLSELISSFDPFDERMQEGTRARLSKDNSKVEEMTRETERLTAALAAQVAVRRDMNQQLQTMCEARVEVRPAAAKSQAARKRLGFKQLVALTLRCLQASYAEFNELVATRTRLVEERLDALDERITALDEHFSEEKSRIGLEIEERHRELNEMLDKFKALFLQECEERAAREAAIKAEMEDHAVDVEERFGVEAEARETVSRALAASAQHQEH